MSDHWISPDGKGIECLAEPNAWCRTRPDCDAERWDEDGCAEHDGMHPVFGGHDCWKIPWINDGGVFLEEYYDGPGSPVTIYPGRGVKVVWEDDYCTWHYENNGVV